MIKFLKKRSLNKLLSRLSSKRFDGLNKAKSALIIFRNETPSKTSLVKCVEAMLSNYGLKMDFVGYLPMNLQKGAEFKEGFFYKNQLNWFGRPKTEAFQDLTNKDFDVIIDLDEELDSPNNFVLLSVKAGIRVGVNKHKEFYDLTVEKAQNSEQSIVNDIEYYLKNIVKA